MIALKADKVFAILDPVGAAREAREGIYFGDTRVVSRYCWTCPVSGEWAAELNSGTTPELVLTCSGAGDGGNLEILRRLEVDPTGLSDRWTIKNPGIKALTAEMRLEITGDFSDIFATYHPRQGGAVPFQVKSPGRFVAVHVASDGVTTRCNLQVEPPSESLIWIVTLSGHGSAEISVRLNFETTLAGSDTGVPLPDRQEWQRAFLPVTSGSPAAERSADDLYALLLSTAYGAYPAAGLPSFSAPFARDGILAAWMVLPYYPDLAHSVLRFLAAHQGKKFDTETGERPGKILHEYRRGEWCRTHRLPFGKSYGSVDSTPLFLILADAWRRAKGTFGAIAELIPAFIAAYHWLALEQDRGNGLIRFGADGRSGGLAMQGWKDSDTGMPTADGRPGALPLAAIEVQGYAVAAFRAAADLFAHLNRANDADIAASRADTIVHMLQTRFRQPELGLYALALDAYRMPLCVRTSNPGHLLWCGAVPEESAREIAAQLTAPDLWSGWGVRTLGTTEKAYDPLAYHCGAVWPFDTALFALGLARYGLIDRARFVARAVVDLAQTQAFRRMPELISGNARQPGAPPEPYPGACGPQAWSAASLIAMRGLLQSTARIGI